MIKFSRNNLKYQNVQSPPEHTANGYFATGYYCRGKIRCDIKHIHVRSTILNIKCIKKKTGSIGKGLVFQGSDR